MRLTLPLVVAFVASTARGETYVPEEPVSPDGFEVVSDRAITVQGGSVLARAAGVYLVTPDRDVKEVRLEIVGEPPRTLKVGPPASAVMISLSGPAPVKNRDHEAQLQIEVAGDGEAAPPVVRANVGRVDRLTRVAPGRFTASYTLPSTRYPEVAIIVAFSAWPHAQSTHGAFGVLRLPLASAVDVPGRAEPSAEVWLSIGREAWGPVKAGSDGSFRLPVVVAPGFGVAQVKTVDRVGNRRTSLIDLMLPPTDELACVSTPSHLPADGHSQARVLCATSDRFGSAARGGRVSLRATAGQLSPPRDLPSGVTEWTWTAPTELGAGTVTLEASTRSLGIESNETLTLGLGQGPVASLDVDHVDTAVHLGARWAPVISPRDALGRVVVGAVVSAEVAGETVISAAHEPSWVPTGAPREVDVAFRAWGPLGDEPARLLIFSEGSRLFVAFTDLSGLPVPAQPFAFDGRASRTGPDGVAALGPLPEGAHSVQHAEWPALRSRVIVRGSVLRFPLTDRPPRVETVVHLRLVPPTPINVRLAREGAASTWWLERPDGRLADDRAVLLTVDGVSRETRSKGRQVVTGAEVSVVDLETGIAAAGVPP